MPTPNILWCGGEDVDFQNQMSSGITVDTGGHNRSSYSRNSIKCTASGNATIRGPSFPGGAITSAWLHFNTYNGFAWNTNALIAGLALTSSGNGSGIYVGTNSSGKLCVAKWDGTTYTVLASGTSVIAQNVNVQMDMNLQNYGASSTINVYVNGSTTAEVTFSGSSAIGGVSNLDCVSFEGTATNITLSEFIVADGDTRTMSLATLAPSAAGTTNNWTTGTYASINPNQINTSNVIAVNTTGQDFQCNLTDLPSGSFTVLAVKVVALAEVTAGSTPTGVKLGVNSGGTVNVGSSNTPGAVWTQYERLMATNPVTSAAWTNSDINALQLDLQSA